ncbi:MAG TPA: caspase family protein [Gemmataceae bacterium]|nr:caspase family protein [Gemmataceae bacterium]
MKRKAILIEASKIPGLNDLPGARSDVNGFRRWLKSANGGAWDDGDITVLSHPTTATLEIHLAAVAKADYAFIAFSGHGEHVVGRLRNDTMIQINEYFCYSANKLASGFKRGLIVVDSCRNVHYELSLNESIKYARAKSFTEDYNMRRRHRVLFDAAAQAAEEGVIFMFGCSLHQSANDFPNGGAFSFALVDQAESWIGRASPADILDTLQAFVRAKHFVEQEVTNQVPEMNGAIRRKIHFPFGVVA